MEEYVDELEGLAESLSDDGHVEINANIDVEKSADPSIKTIQHPDNKRLFIPTNIAEMNAFFGLLSVAEGLAAYGRHWLQAIVNCMAQKETRKQFNIAELQKFSGISEVAIVPTYASIPETAVQSLLCAAHGEEKRIGLESYDLPKSLVDPAKTEEEIENSLASIV
ncbi:hypothetical protein T4A_4287 [Trichinella pseudospiralis]|uniref:Uncharacterized protein n=1 Tax=Trichinella pseudospiralis TaxID=6337 RepID=A0A0V1DTW6_TRIPS|nr:hypothetical protein T4A_4287 [Trichinella pseudospiralis]